MEGCCCKKLNFAVWPCGQRADKHTKNGKLQPSKITKMQSLEQCEIAFIQKRLLSINFDPCVKQNISLQWRLN